MNGFMGKAILFVSLLASFSLLFYWMRRESFIRTVFHRAYDSIDNAARKRVLENRRSMRLLQRRRDRLYGLEKILLYSGMMRRFPFLSPELFLAGDILLGAALYFGLMLLGISYVESLLVVFGCHVFVFFFLSVQMQRNYNATDENLLKFLDFLGNYSLTGGEVTGVLKQVSVYMSEPMKSVLEECYYEATLTGDSGIALLSAAEKLQHPKFKELIRNIEVASRYVADYSALVAQSRRSVREYMRLRAERKALAREAWTNMLLLGGMTVVILKSVEVLIGVPLRELLLQNIVGKMCMVGIAGILLMFYMEVKKIDS